MSTSTIHRSRFLDVAPPPQVADAVADGMEMGWHTGAQLFVGVAGEVVANWAFGEASPGVALTTATSLPWACSTKPLVAVAIAQLVEEGRLCWTDSLVGWIPELAGSGRENISIEQLLTYTAGIPRIDSLDARGAVAETVSYDLDYSPGDECCYTGWTNWVLLDEVLRRAHRRPLLDVLQKHIGAPVGMTLAAASGEDSSALVCGTACDLGQFYTTLAYDGRLISLATLDAMLRPSHVMSRGVIGPASAFRAALGFLTGWQQLFPHCSEDTFGHDAGQLGFAFVDPQCDLVVAFVANRGPGEREAWARAYDVTEAIFSSLELPA
jgi:CubicO group peptidase (beta-lactamase class C family)